VKKEIKRKEKERKKGKNLGKEGIWKIAFWKVAGLGNKDKDFWKRIKEWDMMTLSKTWVDEKGWKKVREKLQGGGTSGGGLICYKKSKKERARERC